MRYRYDSTFLPADPELILAVEQAAGRLHLKLKGLDLENLDISDYNKHYFNHKLARLSETFQLYTYLLAVMLDKQDIGLKDFVLVDYGGGYGFLSLLAKELGVGCVIYNDIYDISCHDVEVIARALDLRLNHVVCGGVDDVTQYTSKKLLSVNGVVSYDVIEHIYDIEGYLRAIRHCSEGDLRLVFGSGANIHNPVTRRNIEKFHKTCEYLDRQKISGAKERDTLRSFLALRKEIIQLYDEDMDEWVVDTLSKATRGLMTEDIKKCVNQYKTTGKIDYIPDHPTNTCDPLTGNWAEHLMPTNRLSAILNEEGFDAAILKGYWSYSSQPVKKAIQFVLNWLIYLSGKHGLVFSPHYVVYANLSDK